MIVIDCWVLKQVASAPSGCLRCMRLASSYSHSPWDPKERDRCTLAKSFCKPNTSWLCCRRPCTKLILHKVPAWCAYAVVCCATCRTQWLGDAVQPVCGLRSICVLMKCLALVQAPAQPLLTGDCQWFEQRTLTRTGCCHFMMPA